MSKEIPESPKSNSEYKDDSMYDIPYSEQEQNKMTQECFLEMIDVIKPVLAKHFHGKLLSPLMLNHMLVPLVTLVYKAQFGDLPEPIKKSVYLSASEDFVMRFGKMVAREIEK